MSATKAPKHKQRAAHKTTAAVITAAALLLAGCATPPPQVATHNEIEAHSTEQIKQAIRADRLSSICADISKNQNSEAQSLYADWLSKEWPTVVGADAYFRSTLSSETLSFEGQTLSMKALRLYADEVESANAKFSYLSRVKTDPSRICLRKMQETISSHSVPGNVRVELLALTHPLAPEAGDRVPSLAGDFTISGETGRSHYEVEQAAKNMSCATPRIITFKNQWPSEIYGAFCSNEHRLISCDWGQCKPI